MASSSVKQLELSQHLAVWIAESDGPAWSRLLLVQPGRKSASRKPTFPALLLLARTDGAIVAGRGELDFQNLGSLGIGELAACLAALAAGTERKTSMGVIRAGVADEDLADIRKAWAAQFAERDGVLTAREASARAAAALRKAVGSFEAGMDAERIESLPATWPDRYRATHVLARHSSDEQALLCQATCAYPWLWMDFLERRARRHALLDAVLSRQPLAELVQNALGALPWQVKTLQAAWKNQLIDEALVNEVEDGMITLARALDYIAPEHTPKTRKGWDYLARATARLQHKPWLAELARVGLDDLATGTKLAKFWLPFKSLNGLKSQAAALRDFLHYCTLFPATPAPENPATSLRQTVEAMLQWRATVDPAVLDWYYDQALPNWQRKDLTPPWQPPVERPNRPARPLIPESAPEEKSKQPTAWEPAFSEPVWIDGFEFVELTSAEALREEGYAMKHCVGGYAHRCLNGWSRIFSVKDSSAGRLATLELLCADRQIWKVAQLFGKCNRQPEKIVLSAAMRLCDQVNTRLIAHP